MTTAEELKEWLPKIGIVAKEIVASWVAVLESQRLRGLRDEFAKAALTEALACEAEDFMVKGNERKGRAQLLAEDAYDVADAMLAARAAKSDTNPDDCAPLLNHGQATERGES